MRCPKCSAVAHVTVFRAALRAIEQIELSCSTCGTRRYGDAVKDLRRYQADAYLVALIAEEEAKVAAAEALRRQAEEEARLQAEEAARAEKIATSKCRRTEALWTTREVARMDFIRRNPEQASTLCASKWCHNPHTSKSMYCSVKCRGDVARARFAVKAA